MSFAAGFLFGNVDAEGRLVDDRDSGGDPAGLGGGDGEDFFDESVREALNALNSSTFSRLFAGVDVLGPDGELDGYGERGGDVKDAGLYRGEIRPVDGAIDYSDLNELADAEGSSAHEPRAIEERRPALPDGGAPGEKDIRQVPGDGSGPSASSQPKFASGVPGHHDVHGETQKSPAVSSADRQLLCNGDLRVSELFSIRLPVKRHRPCRAPLSVSGTLVQEADTRALLSGRVRRRNKRKGAAYYFSRPPEAKRRAVGGAETRRKSASPPLGVSSDLFQPVVLSSWEKEIVWDVDGLPNIREESGSDVVRLPDAGLSTDGWLDAVIWDDCQPEKPVARLTFDLNDRRMLFDLPGTFDSQERDDPQGSPRHRLRKGYPHYRGHADQTPDGYDLDRFNLSNDHHYEASNELQRVRQTFGQLIVQHSVPALKLQHPYFKARLTKAELRSFHRPSFQVPLDRPCHFSRLKQVSRKKLKVMDPTELLRTTKDITLKDNTTFVLLEYSEEYPPIIANVGMGSLLVNYYRKTDPDDPFVPHEDVGAPVVLEPGDASPFMLLGNVDPGQTIPVLQNNLIRAPLFRHDPPQADFLIVCSTYKGHTRHYVREIPYLFCVGQTYPVQEVPAPHSRKATNTVRNRLQLTTFRAMRKSPGHRLTLKQISAMYPEYSDMQMRQRLKEFCDFVRRGHNNGYWKPKGRITIPSEEECRKLILPEMVALYESMLVGQRHLQDTGYGKTAEDGDVDEEGETKLDIEEQLAPWITTRNFVHATQGKSMLQIHGPGDPTGRGEGFSFVRISMKGSFLRAGESEEERLAKLANLPKNAHRYNVAEQQQAYREEIDRVWRLQYQALSDKNEIQDSDEEAEEPVSRATSEAVDASELEPVRSKSITQLFRPSSRASSPALSRGKGGGYDRAADSDDDAASIAGSLSSRTSYQPQSQNKVLVIRRRIRGADGRDSWQSETVKDSAVINAYLRHRQLIEEQSTTTVELEPTDDAEKNRRMQQRIEEQLARLKRNQERRRVRQATKEKEALEGRVARKKTPNPPKKSHPRKESKRRCGNCDQIGHIRTNPVCSMYEKTGGQPLKSLPPAPIKFIYSGKSEAAQAVTAEKTTSGDDSKPPQPEVTEPSRSIKVEGMKLSIRFTMKKDPPTS